MQRTFFVYPLEVNDDDIYSDIKGEHGNQFSLPFLEQCADYIDKKRKRGKVTIRLTIADDANILYETFACPTDDNYLGDEDDDFSEILWALRDYDLSVSVDIRQSYPEN